MIYEITPGGVLDQDYLMHHGIKGQKWGERRFQNSDGSLTPEGMRRYNRYKEKYGEKTANRLMRSQNKGMTEKQAFEKEYKNRSNYNKRKALINTAAGVTGGAAGAVAGYFGGKKLNEAFTDRKSNLYHPQKLSDSRTVSSLMSEMANKYGDFKYDKFQYNKFDPQHNSFYRVFETDYSKVLPRKIYQNNEKILGAVGGALAGSISALGANKIQNVSSGYSKFDINKDGLQKFYDDMNKARND